MNKVTSALHDATHLMPGVPEHEAQQAAGDHGRHEHDKRPHNVASHHGRVNRRHVAPPRVLVRWQNWIARKIG